jgi:hypothetical protein
VDDDLLPLQSCLRPGEQLLWRGQPDPKVWFTAADLYLIPLSILWCSLAIGWEVGASRESGGPVPNIFGIPFVAAGLYLVFGRFFYKRYQKKRTVYAITTQRALVVTDERAVVDSRWGWQPISVRRSRDGRHASVILDSGGVRASGRWKTSTPGNTGTDIGPWRANPPVAFYDVADPELMLAALDQARGSTPRSDDSRHVP